MQWINSVEMQTFLHPGERKIMQRIANVAVKYHQIQKFIKSVTVAEETTADANGIYWSFLCHYLNNLFKSQVEITSNQDCISKHFVKG